MGLEHIFILSVLQGLTEFLPISSSAHLILVPKFVDWPDQGLPFDVSVHVGSLFAVMLYFRRDLWRLTSAGLRALPARLKRREPDLDESQRVDERLFWLVGVATVPVCVIGYLLSDFVEESSRSLLVIAATTIGYGVLLGVADRLRRSSRSEREIGWKDALWIGAAQALAPIPGTSRSGITVTAGLFRSLTRSAAARFSFLMSVPTILIAGAYKTLKLVRSDEVVDWTALGLGALFSFVSALLCIYLFLKLLERIGMMPFVVYRLALGALLIFLALRAPTAAGPSTTTALESGRADAPIVWAQEEERSESGVSRTE